MKKFLLPAILLLTMTASGCATHLSGLQDKAGKQILYVFDDEHTAFAAAYGTIAAIVPDAPVKAMGGPMRGFNVRDGEAVFDISILPGTGRSLDGEKVSGYYVETSLRDEAIMARFTVQKIYRAVIEVFARVGEPVRVSGIKLGKYKSAAFMLDEDDFEDDEPEPAPQAPPRFREAIREQPAPMTVTEAPAPTAAPFAGDKSLVEALDKLNQLRKDGGLTWEEYDELKRQLMRR